MKIPISKIKIGKDRIRKDPGDVTDLAESIQRLGLIHPITLKRDLELDAGLRRLEAVKLLGWTEIEATIGDGGAEEDENTKRKNFTPLEALDAKRRRESIEREESKKRMKAGKPCANLAQGKTRDHIADKIAGFGHTTLAKIEKVAVAAEKAPKKYAAIVKEMNETGNVDRAYRAVTRVENRKDKNLWYQTIHRLWHEFSYLVGDGFLKEVSQDWSAKDVEEYLNDLTEINERCTTTIKALKECLNEKRKIRVVGKDSR